MSERHRADVLVCTCPACTRSGATALLEALREELARRELAEEVGIVETGSRGFCYMGPIVVVQPEGILYTGVHRNWWRKRWSKAASSNA